jgi:hypothetical protein
LRWVEVVEVEVVAAAALVAAAEVGPVAWAAPSPLGRAASASVPTVDTESHMSPVSLVTKRDVPSAVRR